MDLMQDNVAGTELAGQVWSGVSSAAGKIVNKAKKKAAQKVSDGGQYWTLRPYLKSLIEVPQYVIDQVSNQGITKNAVLQLPAQQTGASQAQIINQLKTLSGGGSLNTAVFGDSGVAATPAAESKVLDDNVGDKIKRNLPYILIAVAGAVALYFVFKKIK